MGAGRNMEGRIYGIGIGIGDPEDLTLKAVRMINESDILILPRKDLGKCRAYQIARKVVPGIDKKETLALEFEMSANVKEREENHRKIYEAVRELVHKGKTCAFLTIGDPALYSTYSYIAALAHEDGVMTEAIIGISSVTACANRLGITLCDGGEQLHVIPDTDDLETALDLPGTKVIMKCGKQLPLLKKILRDRKVSVYAVSDCGMPEEKCYRGIDELPGDGTYMLTVIVTERQ